MWTLKGPPLPHLRPCTPASLRKCPITAHKALSRQHAVRVHCAATALRRTHYDVLGVKDTASVRDIKDAFRRLALMWHPDRCKQPGAKDKFLELKQAYDTLVDMTLRGKYDRELKQATAPPPAPSGPNPVGYDWSKYRAASMRRTTSTAKRPTAGHTGFANPAVPPRPPSRSMGADDFDTLSGATANMRSGSASSIFNRTPSSATYASPTSAAGGMGGGYRSIFDAPTGFAQSPPGVGHAGRAPSAAPGTTGGGSVFTRMGGASSTPSNFVRSTSASAYARSSSRSRSVRSSSRSGSTSAWSTRTASPAAPSAAQQWHTMYVHGADDYMPSTGTSYAASTVPRSTSPTSGSSSTMASAQGDGFPGLTTRATSPLALPKPADAVDHSTTWAAGSTSQALGDDFFASAHRHVAQAAQQAPQLPSPQAAHVAQPAAQAPPAQPAAAQTTVQSSTTALAVVERAETGVVVHRQAATPWNNIGSFISIRMF